MDEPISFTEKGAKKPNDVVNNRVHFPVIFGSRSILGLPGKYLEHSSVVKKKVK